MKSNLRRATSISRSTTPAPETFNRLFAAEEAIATMGDADLEQTKSQAKTKPGDGFLQLWLGLALERRGQFQAACQHFAQAINAGCNHWRLGWYIARTARRIGALDIVDDACAAVLKSNPEFWFARELPRHARGYYAQLEQDKIIEEFFAHQPPRTKTFVEVGAFDGVHYSNVRRLHEQYGWTGLCIEPVGKNFSKLTESYRGTNVKCVKAAVSPAEGPVKINVSSYPHLPEWGSDVATLGQGEQDRWTREYGAVWTTETVPARRLTNLVQEAGLTDFDILSIDAEGHDLEVLQSLDFDRFHPQLIVVEYGERKAEIASFLRERGYTIAQDNGQDFIASFERGKNAAEPLPLRQVADANRPACLAKLNPHLLGLKTLPLDKQVRTGFVNPLQLLTPGRFDLAAKHLYAWHRELGVQCNWARALYREHIRAFSGGTFKEGDGSKQSIEDFYRSFDTLLDSIKARGFDANETLVPIGHQNALVDGSHRVAACLLHQRPVSVLAFDYAANRFDSRFFLERGLDLNGADAIALHYCRLKSNAFVLMLFPAAPAGREVEVRSLLNEIGSIVYEKEVRLVNEGPWLFVRQVYDGEPWIGSWADNFANTHRDAAIRFGASAPLRVFFFECDDLQRVKEAKAKIRSFYGLGNYSCHVNDTPAQALNLAQILFNDRSIEFLNSARPQHFESFERQLLAYRQWLPRTGADADQFCVDGSAVMAAHGIRESADLDVLHFPAADFSAVTPLVNSHNADAHHHVYGRDEILFNPALHFHFLGIKFATLDVIRRLKVKRNEEKDRVDVACIDALLAGTGTTVRRTRKSSQTPKIIGLVPARNEARRIAFCLRALARFTDAIVFLDDCSDDNTIQVVESLAKECRVEKIIRKTAWHRDEPGDRNALLDAGRDLGGTHFIVMDADESFTANLAEQGLLRRMIRDLEPGDQLCLTLLNFWRGVRQFRCGGTGWNHDLRPFAFADDGICSYVSRFIHTRRVPENLQGHQCTVGGYAFGVMHFQFVNWLDLMLKQAWYRMLERLRQPERSDEDINGQYWPTEDESDLELKETPADWLAGYSFFDAAIFQGEDSWRQQQMIQWCREHGPNHFAGLDVWRMDWSFVERLDSALAPEITRIIASAKPVRSLPARAAAHPLHVPASKVVFGNGVFDPEGDFRWVDREGELRVSMPAGSEGVRLSFELRCGKLEWYPGHRLNVAWYIGEEMAGEVQFTADFQTERVELRLAPQSDPVRVRIVSDNHFSGSGDTRQLTVQLRNACVAQDATTVSPPPGPEHASQLVNTAPATCNETPSAANGSPSPSLNIPSVANQFLALAEQHFAQGDLESCRNALDWALDVAPGHPQILVALGSVCFQQGDSAAARQHFEAALAVRPDDPRVLTQLAATCLRLDDIPAFESALAKALELNADCVDALRLFGDLNFRDGRHADAINAYRRILSITPEDTTVLLLLGRSLFTEGQLEKAEQAYLRTLQIDPKNEVATENLAVVAGKLGHPVPALLTATDSCNGHERTNGAHAPAASVPASTQETAESLIKRAAALMAQNGGLNFAKATAAHAAIEQSFDAWLTPKLGFSIETNPFGQIFPVLAKKFEQQQDVMRAHAREVLPFIQSPNLNSVPEHKVDEITPYWKNDYFHAGDARLAYAVVAKYRPKLIIECGCGNSTKFMRRAVTDHQTGTRIVCVDPQPRAEIRGVADEFYQASSTTVDLAVYQRLQSGDVLFVDGSHLVMNGSDCVHLFLNIIPQLPSGVWVHFHDIFLPHDYPYDLHVRCRYNEQYLLALLFLYSNDWIPALPIYYAHKHKILPHGGGSFWMRKH